MQKVSWEYGAPIDVELIRAFERDFGRTLPETYVEIARAHDSAIAVPGGIPFSDPDRDCGWNVIGIGQLYSYVEEWSGTPVIRWINRRFAEVTRDYIVFSDCNVYQLAFDFGARELDPPIVLFTYDRSLSGRWCIPVAHSFVDLLARVRAEGDRSAPTNLIPFTPGTERIGKGRFD